MPRRFPGSILLALLLVPGFAYADGGAKHRVRNQKFGVSGGNVKDISKAFCCGGTLGSLVAAGTTQYILSNNHVLARADQAAPGEDITQPGLIDNLCRQATIVADFTKAPPLGSNVDAAIAQLRSGMMDSTGFIEDIGTISSVVRSPSVELGVAKSGRTTGFTTGTISAINANVSVQYQRGCGSGKKFVVNYSNQVVVGGSGFSAGGDSGSLIVTNDACHQPVALLYAGSSTTTIGNPAGEVLTKVGAALGSNISFVGDTKTCDATTPTSGPSATLLQEATRVKDEHAAEWMGRAGVIGVGVGVSDVHPTEPQIVVYVDHTLGAQPDLPEQAQGFRVRRIQTDPFVALPACCDGCGSNPVNSSKAVKAGRSRARR